MLTHPGARDNLVVAQVDREIRQTLKIADDAATSEHEHNQFNRTASGFNPL